MTRGGLADLVLLAMVGTLAVGLVAWLIWSVQLALACGDKGGDIFWGPLMRHVCISWDGKVIP